MQALLAVPTARGEDGLSTRELRKALGIGEERLRRLLTELNETGRLVNRRRQVIAIDGTVRYIPVYHIKPKAQKDKS